MSSSTVSKRLCAVIPRQTRALSLYSHQHLQVNPNPDYPYAAPSPARPSPTSTSRQSTGPISSSGTTSSHSGAGNGGTGPSNGPGSSSSSSSTGTGSAPATQNPSQSSQNPPPAPLQVALTPLAGRGNSPGASSNSPQSIASFPSIHFFPSSFPYLTPSSLHQPTASKRSRLTYHLSTGAYGIPKRRTHTVATLPHPELNLAVQVGEDAYFLRDDAMGVADGVGGWSKVCKSPGEANSALFAKSLMHWCSYELALSAQGPPSSSTQPHPTSVPSVPAGGATPSVDVHPVDILQRSYDRCLASFKSQGIAGGSATALVAVLRDEELRIAHLGDCAVCLVRDGGIVYRSEEMQHAFNYPLQLGPSSPTLPSHARSISIPVQPDDILILSSDGMTDNLWDEDVLDEVSKFTKAMGAGSANGSGKKAYENKWLPGMLSQALCSRAKSVSESRGASASYSTSTPAPMASSSASTASSSILSAAASASDRAAPSSEDEVPFARKAREEGIKFVGGKCDDISVLVAIISPYSERERTSL